jgi:anti-sigma regulatory factor (Ser/Thr protein kinase)
MSSSARKRWRAVPDDASCGFTAELASVGAARRFAQETTSRWGLDSRDVALVVGELAANAVVHGHTPFTVSLSSRDHTVSVEVRDGSSGRPRCGEVSLDAPSGRGLLIVDRLASEWGIRRICDGGKVVWAEIRL